MTYQPADLALGWLTVGGDDPFAWLSAAVAGGFGHMGVKIAPRPGEPAPRLLADSGFRREFDTERRRRGVRLLNMGSIWLDGQHPVETYIPALDLGAEMGASYVVGISTDPDPVRRMVDLKALTALASDRGMRLTIEFFAYSAISSFTDALDALADLAPGQAGVLFDALHFHRSGGIPSDITEDRAMCVDYLQLCDGPQLLPAGMTLSEEGRAARMFAGEGDIALRDIMARLSRCSVIEVEIPHPLLRTLSADECGREVMTRTLHFLNGSDPNDRARR
ncbi:sugar phosphate isomerase/epimerase [Bordetella sp. 15P40C-2]|uniref:sugar phosphate isomerase/epimerase family protein n=1 Tax=Bordetella sp. 15P40C-2 TaxID=2572246 RepID=UPI0013299995|nr:sugar phosphate isomerase/epimerase [Bordetella sp. 15P40C-2]MVW72359.1 TIM barrel protein [Bordetella sp. 15P40C-2]